MLHVEIVRNADNFSIDGSPAEPLDRVQASISRAFYEKTKRINPPARGTWEGDWLEGLMK